MGLAVLWVDEALEELEAAMLMSADEPGKSCASFLCNCMLLERARGDIMALVVELRWREREEDK